MVIHLIAGSIKNISIHKSSYYLQPKNHIWNKIKVELNLSNYAKKKKKKRKKNPQQVDTSRFESIFGKLKKICK